MNAPKPPRENCTYVRTFKVADERAIYVGNFARYRVHVGEGHLWLSKRLSIPLSAIRGKEIIERGWLLKRHVLRVEFDHPETHVRDVIHLCDMNWLGFYRREPLAALSAAIDEARSNGDPIPARATLPPLARRGAKELIAGLFGNVFLPSERLALRYYRDLAESQELNQTTFETADDARSYIARESIRRGGAVLDPEHLRESERKHILAGRFRAGWALFWFLLLPLGLALYWAHDANLSAPAELVFGVLLFYSVLGGACAIVAMVLERPFLWALAKALNIEILYHSRLYW